MELLQMARDHGIFAFRIHGLTGPKDIMALDCSELQMHSDGSIWYKVHNVRNVIPEVERWAYVPPHGILLIAFNEKPNELPRDR